MRLKNIYLYFVFLIMMFWDILDDYVENIEYVLIIVVFLLFAFDKNRLKLNRNFLLVISFLILHGVTNIFIGNDEIRLLVVQVGCIAVCYVVYDTILSVFKVKEIFEVYYQSAFAMAVIAIGISLLQYRQGIFLRAAGLCSEPSFLGYYLAPAVCLVVFQIIAPEYIDKDMQMNKHRIMSMVIVFAYLLTFSAIAYVGIIFMLLIVWLKKDVTWKKIMIPVIVVTFALIAYIGIPSIQLRIDETLRIFNAEDKYSMNLSSFTYYNNLQTSIKAMLYTKGIGSGLGSYQIMFDKFSLGNSVSDVLYSLNREDANSMFLRILSEIGIVGVVGIIYFISHFEAKKQKKYIAYSGAILSLFLLLLLRQGNYTHGGVILFVCLYVKMWEEDKAKNMKESENEEQICE